jgi:hypothetical protein
VTLEGLEALIERFFEAILEVSQERRVKKDLSHLEGHLRYIHYVRESCVEGLLTRMHSSLWLLDFHDLEERAGAESLPGFRKGLGFSIFGMRCSFLL